MPSTMPGRELVKQFLQQNGIKTTDLAKMYGMTKQEVSDYLSGRKVNPASNQFVLKVIRENNNSTVTCDIRIETRKEVVSHGE